MGKWEYKARMRKRQRETGDAFKQRNGDMM